MKLRSLMPELEGESAWLNHKVVRKELIGEKPTLIHFWSVSCQLCKEIMPQVNLLRDKYGSGLNVVAVHMPRSEEDTKIEKVQKAAQKYQITQPIFVDNWLRLSDLFQAQYVPSYYLFDRSGILRHFQSGGSGMKMLEKRILSILADEKNE